MIQELGHSYQYPQRCHLHFLEGLEKICKTTLKRISSKRRSDVFEQARGVLAPQNQRLFKQVAEKYQCMTKEKVRQKGTLKIKRFMQWDDATPQKALILLAVQLCDTSRSLTVNVR
jgi:hypothetical protein